MDKYLNQFNDENMSTNLQVICISTEFDEHISHDLGKYDAKIIDLTSGFNPLHK